MAENYQVQNRVQGSKIKGTLGSGHYKEKMAAVARRSMGLYRQLLRKLSPLPADAQEHYKHRIRQVRY